MDIYIQIKHNVFNVLAVSQLPISLFFFYHRNGKHQDTSAIMEIHLICVYDFCQRPLSVKHQRQGKEKKHIKRFNSQLPERRALGYPLTLGRKTQIMLLKICGTNSSAPPFTRQW